MGLPKGPRLFRLERLSVTYPGGVMALRPTSLVFEEGVSWMDLGLKGSETVTIRGIKELKPLMKLTAHIAFADGAKKDVPLLCRIDTLDELNYFKNGGILHYVLRNLAAA